LLRLDAALPQRRLDPAICFAFQICRPRHFHFHFLPRNAGIRRCLVFARLNVSNEALRHRTSVRRTPLLRQSHHRALLRLSLILFLVALDAARMWAACLLPQRRRLKT
jgi:hypothetical protein